MLSALALTALLLPRSADAGCPADLATLRTDMGTARMAYADEDLEALRQAVASVDEDLGCLTEPATPDDALQAHVVHALGWWLMRDEERVAFALRGAFAVDPTFIPGDDIAPAGSRLMVLYTRVRDEGTGLSAPASDKLRLDGFDGIQAVPMERAALVQREGEDGLETFYLTPDGVPTALLGDVPYGWRSEGKYLVPVPEERRVLDELLDLARRGENVPWISAKMNEQGLLMGAEPWNTRRVKQQLDVLEQGGLRHTRKRRRAGLVEISPIALQPHD